MESVSEWIGGIGDLSDYIDTIMAAMRNLASGTVDLMEAALDTLRDLPGDLGKLFAQLIDNGQDWIEAMVLIASETNAFEYVFHVIMAVAMNMVPNFWSEMVGVVTGFILPEVLIEIILAVIAALTVGGGSVLVAGRLTTFVVKLRGLAVKAKSLGVLADILEAFGKAITALAKIGKGLHDEIEAMTRAGADGVARIRRRLNQYKVEIDPDTLGEGGKKVQIVRKTKKESEYAKRGVIRKNIKVESEFQMGGQSHFDVNQTARNPNANGLSRSTAISDDIKVRNGREVPNRTYGSSHAEIGAMQQAYEQGARGGAARLNVTGQELCPYCLSDVKKMANRLELEELIVVDPSGTYRWTPETNKLDPL